MEKVVAIEDMSRQGRNRAYALMLMMLVGAGVIGALAAVCEDSFAQAGAKGKGQDAVGKAAMTDCDPNWVVVNSPSPGQYNNRLNGVVALSSSDVWAVGYYNAASVIQTLLEHWDGGQWNIVSSPNPGGSDSELSSVAVVSATDVWAVGGYDDGTRGRTLVEHWDGSQWNVVSSSSPGVHDNYLSGVAAVSANDLWAVGSYSDSPGAGGQTLVEHWNGSTWLMVSSPSPGVTNNLHGVAAVSATDVWAVGDYYSITYNTDLRLVEHWDGSAWNAINFGRPIAGTSNKLNGVAAVSANDVWAVGDYYNGSMYQTLVEHWDGSAWNIVSSPSPGAIHNHLYGVAAVSANDVWVVGYYLDDSNAYHTLMEHWNGSTWSWISSPSPGTTQNNLFAVAAVSANDVWAVGDYYSGSIYQTLVERYNPCSNTATPTMTRTTTPTNSPSPLPTQTPGGASATPIPTNTPTATMTAQPTQTPGGASATPVPSDTPTALTNAPTGTPASTPTACTISFTDVPPGSTFYPYVHCLACLGIINGYSDGSFKPNNNVTRGQLSKIVSNSAGFNDPQTTQMFEDVPAGSTFFQYIGRLASRGYIGGYLCGGSGEPCGPNNLPYFRPNANATRGQITKIDSNAADFTDDPSGQQFEDVAVGSAFYTYTFRLVTRGIMSGYPCGVAGEPCGPGNLPYFRTSNNATRGQTSKIVANTFFPNCETRGRR